jgi:hypothetical protein
MAKPIEYDWEGCGGKLMDLVSMIRARYTAGWELHSWSTFTLDEHGGSCKPYENEEFYAIWRRQK